MCAAIGRITGYMDGMTFEDFLADPRTTDAVLYNLIILGEASTQLPVSVRDSGRDIPWSWMRGLRNLAVHAYFRVDLKVIWDTVRDDLPLLLGRLNELIEVAGP